MRRGLCLAALPGGDVEAAQERSALPDKAQARPRVRGRAGRGRGMRRKYRRAAKTVACCAGLWDLTQQAASLPGRSNDAAEA